MSVILCMAVYLAWPLPHSHRWSALSMHAQLLFRRLQMQLTKYAKFGFC